MRPVAVAQGAVPAGVTLVRVSAGGSHSLALGSNGRVYGWGRNGFGQLGDGTTEDRVEPVEALRGELPEGVVATAVSAGWEHSLALGSDGRLYGWGRNGFGQVGDGSGVNRTSARRVTGPEGLRFSGVAAGRFHSLGLGEDGRGWAWGRNGSGQLGDGTTEEQAAPVEVARGAMEAGVVFVGMSAGWQHSVGLGSDGRAYAWGGNGSGQLGDGTVDE